MNFTICTLWVLGQHRIHGFLPTLVGVVGQDVSRLATQLQQELGHAHHVVRIAPQAELLAVQPGVRVGHHVNQTATLFLQLGRDWLASDLADQHQEFVSPIQTHWDVEVLLSWCLMLPGVLNQLQALGRLPWLQEDGVQCVRRIFHLVLGRAASVHAELAVSRGIQHFFRIGQQRDVYVHVLHHALDHTEVTQIGFKARHDVQFAVGTYFLVFHVVQREVAGNTFKHVVPTRGVGTNK